MTLIKGVNRKKYALCSATVSKQSKGAISSLDIDYNDKENIDNIIKLLKPIINDGFCSVDIIKTKDSNFYVMEINSGVMMQNFIKQNENGYMIAKLIYKEAIIEMFNN